MIGAPWCEGQNLEGADLAPWAMREAGISDAVRSLGLEWDDRGDVDFSTIAPSDHPLREHHYSVDLYREWMAAATPHNFAKWMQEKTPKTSVQRKRPHEDAVGARAVAKAVNVLNAELMGGGLKLVHEAVRSALTNEAPAPFVLSVGGDHSIASATISAMIARYPSLGVIWIDAHADANTPRSSPSGHYHGSACSAIARRRPPRCSPPLSATPVLLAPVSAIPVHVWSSRAQCLRRTCLAGSINLARWARGCLPARSKASTGSPRDVSPRTNLHVCGPRPRVVWACVCATSACRMGMCVCHVPMAYTCVPRPHVVWACAHVRCAPCLRARSHHCRPMPPAHRRHWSTRCRCRGGSDAASQRCARVHDA